MYIVMIVVAAERFPSLIEKSLAFVKQKVLERNKVENKYTTKYK